MRLNQFLARAGVCSRRGGDELISRGVVTVNGAIVKDLGRQVEPDKDAVKVNGKRVFAENIQYFLFNKPDGVMCTLSDPEGRPHLGDVIRKLGGGRLYPVGRLDFNTEGLLLLTNDGDLTQKLLHPKFQVARTYQAKVQGILTNDEFEKFAKGVRLEDGWATAEVKPIQKMQTNSYVSVTVRESRNRLVRRLFEAAGHPIVKLQRVGFGPLSLGGLVPGEVRRMTPEEVRTLVEFAAHGPAKTPVKAGKKPSGPPQRTGPGRDFKGSPKRSGDSGPKRFDKGSGGFREGHGPKREFGSGGFKGPKKSFGGSREGVPQRGDHKSNRGFGSAGANGPGPQRGDHKSTRKSSGDFGGDREPKREFGSGGFKGPKKSFGRSFDGGPRKSSGGFREGGPRKGPGGSRDGGSRPRKYTGSYNPAGPKKTPKDRGPG